MLKALLRKQMLETKSYFLNRNNRKKGKDGSVNNSGGMMAVLIILYVVIMISMFFMSLGIGSSLLPAGLDWLYFTIINVLSFLIGVVGSAFSTAQAIFRSKDNELLLSMPIAPSKIVFVRMISVYLISLFYGSVVLIPGIIYYFIAGSPSFLSVILCVISIFVMGFLITAVSCAAGWLVAFISSRLNNQKVILVILIALLIGVLYYFQFNASRFIRTIILEADRIADALEGWGYPLYAPGLGMTGNIPGFLVFLGITAAGFGLAYYAVSKSFTRIALTKTVEKKVDFKKTAIRTSRVGDTLLRREIRRFLASISYMLNGGLGILFLLAVAVIVFLNLGRIREWTTSQGWEIYGFVSLTPVLAVCLVCILSSFCLMASCSISLEGKMLWILQSMPLDPYQIFRAKIGMHLLLTGIPALICVLAMGIAVGASITNFICMVVFTMMYIVFNASFQLMMDLRKPKLSWTNETQALKTNMTVLLDMLIGVIAPVFIGGLYLLLFLFLSPELYLVIWIALFAFLTLLLHRWFAGRGREIFLSL